MLFKVLCTSDGPRTRSHPKQTPESPKNPPEKSPNSFEKIPPENFLFGAPAPNKKFSGGIFSLISTFFEKNQRFDTSKMRSLVLRRQIDTPAGIRDLPESQV